MSDIHLQKLPASPAFLICIHSLSSSPSLLSSITPPHLSPSVPQFLPLSVPLCIFYHPALLHLHCGAALTIRALHTSAHTCKHTHTHRGRHTPTTSGSPPPALTPLCWRHETFYNPWCASVSSGDTTSITSKQYSELL